MSKYGVPRVNVTFKDINKIEEGYRIYKDTTSFDETTLPTPLVDISAEDVANFKLYNHFDGDVLEGNTYFYRVGAYGGGEEILSDERELLCSTSNINYIYLGTEYNRLIKIDPNGNEVWRFTGHTDRVSCVSLDSDGFIYSGGWSVDGTVKKLDSDGNVIWSYDGNASSVYGIAVGTDNHVYAGYHSFGQICKIDPQGNEVWKIQPHTDRVWGNLTVDSNDNIYTASRDGSFKKIDQNGNVLWTLSGFNYGYGVGVDIAGNVYICPADGSIRKYDYDLNLLWKLDDVTSKYLAVDQYGFCYTGGNYSTVKKVDGEGNIIWEYVADTGIVQSVAIDADGYSYSAWNDGTVKKLTPTGQLVWSYQASSGVALAVAVYPGPLHVSHGLPF